MSTFAIIASIVVVVSVLSYALGWNLPREYRGRPCQGRSWRREFPAASKKEIRQFLGLFVTCFGFRKRDRLQFAPTDGVFAVFRAINSTDWDALELETLSHGLASEYGIDLRGIWKDNLTLGQLFTHAQGRASNDA